MDEIPAPQILTAARIDRDNEADETLEQHRARARLTRRALDESCAYAEQLWQMLDAVRGYLDEHTPPPDAGDADWAAWRQTYAATTSVLCGPDGDAGYGQEQAQVIAQQRRAPA